MSSRDRGTIRLSAAVMTHPSRSANAAQLRLRHPELDLTVITDPDPHGPPSAVRTARLAWKSVSPDATHHLVVQDDAILSQRFLSRVIRAIEALPNHAVCLFTDWGSRTSYALRLAAFLGHDWAEVIDRHVPSVGLVLPARHALGFATDHEAITSHDDAELRRYLAGQGAPVCVTVPNLVDHIPGRSLMGNDRLGPRRSAWFGAARNAPGEIETIISQPAAIPFISPYWAIPRCALRPARHSEKAELSGRSAVPLASFLAEHQVSVSALSKASMPVLSKGWSDKYGMPPRRRLVAIWLTAVALGMCWRHEAGMPAASLTSALGQPVAQECLATMAAGWLSWRPGGESQSATSFLADVLRAGVQTGFEAGD